MFSPRPSLLEGSRMFSAFPEFFSSSSSSSPSTSSSEFDSPGSLSHSNSVHCADQFHALKTDSKSITVIIFDFKTHSSLYVQLGLSFSSLISQLKSKYNYVNVGIRRTAVEKAIKCLMQINIDLVQNENVQQNVQL